MEKCWFVLKQTHYAPPDTKARTGLIQLGHLIPDLKRLDQVINVESGPLKFRRGMVVSKSHLEGLTFGHKTGREVNAEVNATVPIAAAAGAVSAGAQVGTSFKKTVENNWEFERVETEIFQPTRAYVADSLQNPEVQEYLKTATTFSRWTMFMISGIAVAVRGGKHTGSESTEVGVHGGPNVSVAGAVDVGVDLGFKKDDATTSSFKSSSDYIWAVRLTKLHRGILSDLVDVKTFVKGATYSADGEGIDKELEDDGFGHPPVFQLKGQDSNVGELFVMPEDFELLDAED
ncbi:hypothetical protein ABW20_dc0108987 [Dactylellina cionopaga]|nr:hypothetical protein ABW20_dc0108987 [Dactylellina cionopaga]